MKKKNLLFLALMPLCVNAMLKPSLQGTMFRGSFADYPYSNQFPKPQILQLMSERMSQTLGENFGSGQNRLSELHKSIIRPAASMVWDGSKRALYTGSYVAGKVALKGVGFALDHPIETVGVTLVGMAGISLLWYLAHRYAEESDATKQDFNAAAQKAETDVMKVAQDGRVDIDRIAAQAKLGVARLATGASSAHARAEAALDSMIALSAILDQNVAYLRDAAFDLAALQRINPKLADVSNKAFIQSIMLKYNSALEKWKLGRMNLKEKETLRDNIIKDLREGGIETEVPAFVMS